MVERSTERNLYLGTRDMKPGPAADQEKTNRRQLVAKVASRTHALSETVKAVATFDAAGNMPLVLIQIGAVADDLNDAVDELMKSMGEVSHRAGLHRPLRVVLGPDAKSSAGVKEPMSGGKIDPPSGAGTYVEIRPAHDEVAFSKQDAADYFEGRIEADELFRPKNFPCAAVRVSLDESVPTPLQVARDHIDRERRAGQ